MDYQTVLETINSQMEENINNNKNPINPVSNDDETLTNLLNNIGLEIQRLGGI